MIRERTTERFGLGDFHEAVKGRHDRELGVIRDAKLMGLESKNNRRYRVPDSTLFEGAAIRLNHHGKENGPEMPNDPPFEGIWAVARNVKVSAEGVRGDIHYNKSHPMVPTILWWAENHPTVGGFSPVTWSMRSEQGGETVMDILAVESIDLVDRPATTRGIFEREQPNMDPKELELLKESVKGLETKVVEAENRATEAEKRATEAEAKAAEAQGKLVAQEAAAKASERRAAREKLLADAKLPEGVVTEALKEAVVGSASDESARALIETVVKAAGAPRSDSTTPGGTGPAKVASYEAAKAAGSLVYRENV
jgi:hypothetical protein